MATTKQVSTLKRLCDKAYNAAGNDLGYSVIEITNGTPYEDLSNAKVTQLMDLFRDEIEARRCEHCHARIRDTQDVANHSLVRYYDEVYGPNCGLS